MNAASQDTAPADVLNILTDTSALRIEYRADLGLRVLESQRQLKWREYKDTIAALYDELGTATSPYPKDYAATGLDTLERAEANGSMLSHLDGLSLRLRLLRDTASDMPMWTKQQFKEIRLAIPPTPCTSATVPIPDAYYQTLGDLFFPSDRDPSMHDFSWLEETILSARSSMQLPSVADLITRLSLTSEQLSRAVRAYVLVLQDVRTTDRELGYLMSTRNFPDSLYKLVGHLDSLRVPTHPLVQAYLQFLRNGMNSERCQDSKTNWSSLVYTFNNTLAPAVRGYNTQRVSIEDIGHQQLSFDRAVETPMPSGEEADDLLGKLYRLHTGKDSPLSILFGFEDRTSQMNSYGNQLDRLATQILSTPSPCHICAVLRAEKILLDGFDLLPDGAMRTHFLERLVSLLSSDGAQEAQPGTWNLNFNILLNMARPIADKQSKQLAMLRQQDVFVPFVPRTMQRTIREALLNSDDSVMSTSVKVDELVGTYFTAPYLH